MYENEIAKEIVDEFNKLKKDEIKNETKLRKITLEILCLYPINEGKKQIRKYLETMI